MSEFPRRLRRFAAELRRRKVIRVALAYGAVAFVIVQVADIAFPALHLPGWTITFVVVTSMLGFPVALLLSWAYELTPDSGAAQPGADAGVQALRTADTPADPSAGPAPEPAPRISWPQNSNPSAAALDGLPLQPTVFVGRARECQEIEELLRSPAGRLLTLSGPGGVGKTRLALEVAARQASAFPDGVCYVPLGTANSVSALLASLAERLRLPVSSRGEPKLQILGALREKRLLLILDNFEHLTEGGAVLAELLEQAPGVKLIVTSRERLNLHGEVFFPLDGLSYAREAAGDGGVDSDAVRLFVQNARAQDPHFSLRKEDGACIVRITQLVEGIPLALELAAAWVRVLSCAEIAQEIQQNHDFLSGSLRDVPDRHRSLRAVFDSSWRLLSEPERRAYRRLSVFQGSFGRAAAVRVAGADIPALSVLLDKSLVRRGSQGRFEILEVLRQFAQERLAEDAIEQGYVQQLHCEHYVELLRELGDKLDGPDESEALDRIGEELENLRAAALWAVAHGRATKLPDLLNGVFLFYDGRGRAREGEEFFRQLTEAIAAGSAGAPEDRRLLAVLAWLTARQGVFCLRLGLHPRAQELLEQALSWFRSRDDRPAIAFALDRIGAIAHELGEYDRARRLLEESLALARELDDRKAVVRSLVALATVAHSTGNYAEAKQRYREGLEIRRQLGDRKGMWTLLCNLGTIAATEQSHAEAYQLLRESLALAQEMNNRRAVATALVNLGCLAADVGDYGRAREHLEQGIEICREMGYRSLLVSCLLEVGSLALGDADPERAAAFYREALTAALPIGKTPLVLEALVGVGRVLALRDEAERAVELLGLVLQHPASEQSTRGRAQELLDELQPVLPTRRFEQARERGRSLQLEAVTPDVLQDLRTTVAA